MTGEYVTAAKIAGSQKYIVIQNVSHEFKFTKYGLPVLENIHLDIARGEFVALLGPSGSGKSTLLKIIAGLLTPIAGKVIIDGTSIEGPTPRVGVTFQKPILLPWRTVKANLRLPAELAGTWNEKSKARADMLLNVSGLTSFDEVYQISCLQACSRWLHFVWPWYSIQMCF